MKISHPKFSLPLVRGVLVLALASTGLLACHDSDETGSNPVEFDGDSTSPIDSLKVKTNLRTFVYGQSFKKTGRALVRRVTQRADVLDASVRTIVMSDDDVASLTPTDYSAFVRFIAHGGNFVYCNATRSGVDVFIRNLKAVGLGMHERGELTYTENGYRACRNILHIKEDASGLIVPPFIDDDETDGTLCDVLAFRGGDYYVVANLDDDQEVETSVTSDDVLLAGAANQGSEESDMPEDYMYGLHADGLAAWLDTPADEEALMAKGRALLQQRAAEGDPIDLTTIAKAQTFEFSFNASAGSKFAPVEVKYMYWSVNDTRGADYYLIHQEVQCKNSKLNCGPSDKYTWDTGKSAQKAFKGLVKKKVHAYWAYLTDFKMHAQMNNGQGEVEQVSPTNRIGSSTYKETMTWSLNSAFVLGVNSHVSANGGVTMTKEWTRNVPDLNMTFAYNDNNPIWDYVAGTLPKCSHKYGQRTRHEEAVSTLRQDVTLGHSWIWKVKDADKQYSVTTNVEVNLQGMWYDVDYNKDGKKNFTTKVSKTFTLMPPPRYQQKWIMDITPRNDDMSNYMQTIFPDEWLTAFSLYTVEQKDRAAINAHINTLCALIDSNAVKLTKDSIKTFTLQWKLANEQNYLDRKYTFIPNK